MSTDFIGRRKRLFGLALWTSLLTVLTLGFYRFWMKTRLRRYYWSSIRPGGVPLEYTGDPLEKLLGFLIAVTFLAFYIGIVNLILMYFSFAFFHGSVTGYVVSFIGVIPFYFYAQYRARRYVLARTRWRGIRFGLEPGAWGYAWRALVHFALTLVTAGLLWPRMTFWLEKYRTDRTFFGNVRMHQNGRWQMLFPKIKHLAIGAVIVGIGAAIVTTNESVGGTMIAIGAIWFAIGWVYYRVETFKLLTQHKTVGDVSMVAAPRTTRIVGIYCLGSLLLAVIFAIVLFALMMLLVFLVQGTGSGIGFIESLESSGTSGLTPVSVITGIMSYFAVLLLWGAFTQVFITLPRMRHYAETMTVLGDRHLPNISQRARDEFAEAEGFAEALDVGAAL